MNPYEEILNTMREQGKKDNTAPIQIGVGQRFIDRGAFENRLSLCG